MNLRELEYLIAIADELHFHKAADKCFVSQPTLSGQLKKLEKELGVLLIERNNRQVNMTDAGKAIAEQARQIMAGTKMIKEIAQSFSDPMLSEIQLGLIPTVAPYLLPHIMMPLRAQFPQLKLWLHEYQTHILLDKLRHSEVDLLILALPVSTNEFQEIDLFKEDFCLAVEQEHPLASNAIVDLDALNRQEILLLEEGHCLRDQALDICYSAGAKEFDSFHASSLETLRHMVGEGMGMTLMPKLAVPKYQAAEDKIRYIPFKKPAPTRRIGMLFRKGTYREGAYREIAQVVKTCIAKLD